MFPLPNYPGNSAVVFLVSQLPLSLIFGWLNLPVLSRLTFVRSWEIRQFTAQAVAA